MLDLNLHIIESDTDEKRETSGRRDAEAAIAASNGAPSSETSDAETDIFALARLIANRARPRPRLRRSSTII